MIVSWGQLAPVLTDNLWYRGIKFIDVSNNVCDSVPRFIPCYEQTLFSNSTSEKSSFVEHDDSSCQHDNRQDMIHCLWTWNKSSCQPKTHIMSTWNTYHVNVIMNMISCLQTTYHVNVFMNMISRLHDMQYVNMLTWYDSRVQSWQSCQHRIVSCVNDRYHVDTA